MARRQRVLETVTCDICGKDMDDADTIVLGWGKEQWELDLCDADNEQISKTFDSWIAGGRRVRASRGRGAKAARVSQAPADHGSDDWGYLESLGFKRHRGRKSAAEQDALAKRAS